jgi:hypothetical protein
LDVLYRAFKGDMPYSEQLKIREKLVTRGLLLAAGTMAYVAMMSDDEAYKRAKPEERYGSWFMYLPGFDEPVRVPIPFELGYLFKALPEALWDMASNDEKASKAVGGWLKLVAQTNPDVCIVAVGAMATTALESAKTLQASGYSVEVLDPIQVLPVNAGLIEYLSDRDYVVTIEDGLVDGGIGEAIGSALRANNSATRLMSLGIPKRFLDHASRKSILQKLHLDAQGIAATIEQGLKSKVR